jgi:F-type H+-transporting ATPase subunit c
MDGIENIAMIKSAACIAAAFAIAVGCVGPALGQGMIGKQACDSIGKYPESSSKIQTAMMISLAAVESSAVYCLAVAALIIIKVL